MEIKQLLNNIRAKEETSREILKYFELNENENKIYQNLWDAALSSAKWETYNLESIY